MNGPISTLIGVIFNHANPDAGNRLLAFLKANKEMAVTPKKTLTA